MHSIDWITGSIIDSAMRIHGALGPGLFESVYEVVVVEIKSVVRLAPIFEKQLQTYLRLTDCRAGLLINFNETLLKHGIKRIVNRLAEDPRRPPLPRVPRVK